MTKVVVKYKQKSKHANVYQTWFFLAYLKREVTPDNIVESVDFPQVLYGKYSRYSHANCIIANI